MGVGFGRTPFTLQNAPICPKFLHRVNIFAKFLSSERTTKVPSWPFAATLTGHQLGIFPRIVKKAAGAQFRISAIERQQFFMRAALDDPA